MGLRPAFAFVLVASLVPAPAARAEDGLATTVRAGRAASDGASTTRVDADEFATGQRHAAELVATAPGTAVLDFGGALATSTVSVRGGTADQVQVVFDGVPLNASAGGGFDLSRIPAALVDSIEVRRGSDARSGAGAMGGAIALVPASRSRAVISGGTLATAGASASLAHEQQGASGLTRLSGAVDLRRSSGAFTYHRDPTPELAGNDAPETFARANNDALLGSALLRAEHLFGEGRALDAFALGSYVARGLPGPIYAPTPGARQREWSGLAQLRWRDRVAGGRLELPLSLRTARLGASALGLGESAGTQQSLDAALGPAWSRAFGDVELALRGLAGWERFDGPLHGERERLRAGLGAELLRSRGTWTWSAAARADRWAGAWAVVPRAGASVRAGRGVTLHANAGGGFRPPSFGELYFSAGPVVPNPDLRPERSWSGDLGARFASGGSLVAVSVFGASYRDVIVYELFSGFRAKPFNVGAARALGLELEARHAFDAGVSLSLAATELLATNLVEGHNSFGLQLPYRPQHRLVARGDLRRERVRAGVEVQLTGEAFTNRANTRRVPGFADVRANAGLALGRDLWLSLEVRNALDVTDRASIEGYPLPGRVALAHVSWEPAHEGSDP